MAAAPMGTPGMNLLVPGCGSWAAPVAQWTLASAGGSECSWS